MKKIKSIIEDIADALPIVTTILFLAAITIIVVVGISCEIISDVTMETVSDTVCEVSVEETQISSNYIKGSGIEESYYVTVKGESFFNVVETSKETYLECKKAYLEKETINVQIVEQKDCFGNVKTKISIVV